jgi:type IV secretion system protein VirB1
MIPVAEFLQLAEVCARPVPAQTLLAIARTESALYPWALSINRPRRVAQGAGVDGEARLARQPRSRAEALRWATHLEARGITVSLGLMQINSEELTRLGVPLAAALDPCTNLKLGALLLSYHYRVAGREGRVRGAPMAEALSRYNSGHPSHGLRSGYVDKVFGAAGR